MSDTTAITIRLSADIDMAIELYVNEKGSLKEISEITGVRDNRCNGTHDNENASKEEYTAQDGRRGV